MAVNLNFIRLLIFRFAKLLKLHKAFYFKANGKLHSQFTQKGSICE